jgi:DNA-binding transcriptional MerR regulator
MPEQQLTIGELANRTGVATSALRYWEEIGLLSAPTRVSGQRRYPPSAVERVGEILLLRDVGFTLRELTALITARSSAGDGWRELHQRKLAELDQRIAQAQAARTAIAHALHCPHEDIHARPNFGSVVAARLAGSTLEQAHPHQP